MPVVTKMSNGYVQIDFERVAPNGLVFRASIVAGQAQFDLWTPEQIQLIEQERYDAWWAVVSAPQPLFPPEGFDYYYDEQGEIVRSEDGRAYLVLLQINDPLPVPPWEYAYERDAEGNLVLNILGQPILAPLQGE